MDSNSYLLFYMNNYNRCSLRVYGMASNPTPRAYLGDLCNIDKSNKSQGSLKKCLSYKQEHNAEQDETEHDTLFRKIDSVTKTCTKPILTKF